MTKLEQAARQALEALEMYNEHGAILRPLETTNTLREALDQDIDCPCGSECIKCSPRVLLAEQAEQEPVAFWNGKETAWFEHELCGHPAPDGCTIPLYTRHVRTKDLTDDEIAMCMGKDLWNVYKNQVDFARAVIAADREKNK